MKKKKFGREHILFFYRKFWVFPFFFVFLVFFGLFRNSVFRLFHFYTEAESLDVSIEPKQTEDPPKQFKREYIWVFFKFLGLLRFVSVCYETYLFVSVVSI